MKKQKIKQRRLKNYILPLVVISILLILLVVVYLYQMEIKESIVEPSPNLIDSEQPPATVGIADNSGAPPVTTASGSVSSPPATTAVS